MATTHDPRSRDEIAVPQCLHISLRWQQSLTCNHAGPTDEWLSLRSVVDRSAEPICSIRTDWRDVRAPGHRVHLVDGVAPATRQQRGARDLDRRNRCVNRVDRMGARRRADEYGAERMDARIHTRGVVARARSLGAWARDAGGALSDRVRCAGDRSDPNLPLLVSRFRFGRELIALQRSSFIPIDESSATVDEARFTREPAVAPQRGRSAVRRRSDAVRSRGYRAECASSR